MINFMMEWLGLIIYKPKEAFKKVATVSYFWPGFIIVMFIALFSSFYSRWVFFYQIDNFFSNVSPELNSILQSGVVALLQSRFLFIIGIILAIVFHFFITSFYLLWIHLFGYSIKACYLWNSLALASIPTFFQQLLFLILSFFFNVFEFPALTLSLSFFAWIWSFYLFILAVSTGGNIKTKNSLLIVLLPWVLILIFFISLMIWTVYFSLAHPSFFKLD